MNAFKCDRCGKLFERYLEMDSDKICRIVPNTSTTRIHYLDLCKDCNDELQDWVNAFKKKEEGEIPNETCNDV